MSYPNPNPNPNVWNNTPFDSRPSYGRKLGLEWNVPKPSQPPKQIVIVEVKQFIGIDRFGRAIYR